jgi:beta-phosphoglucomutase family hydrolase
MTTVAASSSERIGLPPQIAACLFDLDGVLTDTARIHAAAWKRTLDGYLAVRSRRVGSVFVPFDLQRDYVDYVDGKARGDGVRSFLRSRGIDLPEGSADDAPDRETIAGLANRKNELVLELLRRTGTEAYPDAIAFVQAAHDAGLRCAVVSSSANCAAALESVGLAGLFDVRMDSLEASRRHLPGKPAPDTFLAAAALLDVEPAAGAVFEDSLAGVEAARAGGFGLVVGIDRAGRRLALFERGADVVVADLRELLAQAG